MARKNPATYYYVIDERTRRHVGTGAMMTRRAAESQARHQRRDRNRQCFVAAIPAADVRAYQAAYLRQHGTERDRIRNATH